MTIMGKGVQFGRRYRWRRGLQLLGVPLNPRFGSDWIDDVATVVKTRNYGCVGWAAASAVIERC